MRPCLPIIARLLQAVVAWLGVKPAEVLEEHSRTVTTAAGLIGYGAAHARRHGHGAVVVSLERSHGAASV